MKKFSELELIQNLSWKQVIAYFSISITTLIGATWTIATRTADSKADYVNMRYAEISTLELQVKQLEEENIKLKMQLGITDKSISLNKKSVSEDLIKEIKLNQPIIDDDLDLIYTLTVVWSDSVRFNLTFFNGKNDYKNVSIGSSFNVKTNKEYQFILISVDYDNKTAKYMIKEIPTNK